MIVLIVFLGILISSPILAKIISPIKTKLNWIDNFIAPLIYLVMKKIGFKTNLPGDKFKMLEISKNTYIFESLLLVYKFVVVGTFVFFLAFISQKEEIKDNKLKRPDYLGVTTTKEVYFTSPKEVGKARISLKKKTYTFKELKAMVAVIKKELNEKVLGENKTKDEIKKSLNLFSSLSTYGVNIVWKVDSKVINYDGSLNPNLEVDRFTEIKAEVYYKSNKLFDEVINLTVKKSDDISKGIGAYLVEKDGQIELPDEVAGKKLSWSSIDRGLGLDKLIFLIILGGCVYIFRIKKIDKDYTDRLFEIEKNYTNILNVLVLYIEAGLSLTNAWEMVVIDFRRQGGYISKVLEKSLNEFKLGISLEVVFKNFAERCGCEKYNRLSQLLVQNIKNGSSTIVEALKLEMREAMKDRLSLAKVMAVKAQAKLMLPMMLMLLVVFIIILSPSIISLFL